MFTFVVMAILHLVQGVLTSKLEDQGDLGQVTCLYLQSNKEPMRIIFYAIKYVINVCIILSI